MLSVCVVMRVCFVDDSSRCVCKHTSFDHTIHHNHWLINALVQDPAHVLPVVVCHFYSCSNENFYNIETIGTKCQCTPTCYISFCHVAVKWYTCTFNMIFNITFHVNKSDDRLVISRHMLDL